MEYVVEVYLPRARRLEDRDAQARLAAEALTEEGTPVLFLRSIYLRGDEICLFLFEAESAEVVRQASARADIDFERIVEAGGYSDQAGGAPKL